MSPINPMKKNNNPGNASASPVKYGGPNTSRSAYSQKQDSLSNEIKFEFKNDYHQFQNANICFICSVQFSKLKNKRHHW